MRRAARPAQAKARNEKEVTKMEKEEIELASDKSASDIEITVEELLDFGIDVDQVIQRRC